MTGRVYRVDDLGRGGKDGYVCVYTYICVDRKVHITRIRDNHGVYFSTPILCDGTSCVKTIELDENAVAEVLQLIASTPALSAGEKT